MDNIRTATGYRGRRNSLVLLSVGVSLMWPIVGLAQFRLPALEPGGTDANIIEIYNQVHELKEQVVRYDQLTEDEKRNWESRVGNPYDESGVPLDVQLVEQMFELVTPENYGAQENFWKVAHDAFIVLEYVTPTSPRLRSLSKRILEAPLPPIVKYVPHENLYAGCLIVLLMSGQEQDFEYFISTERVEFWKDRLSDCKLQDPSEFNPADGDSLLRELRSRAPMVAAANNPEFAVKWLTSIIERPEEDDAYRAMINQCLLMARSRLPGASNLTKPKVYE